MKVQYLSFTWIVQYIYERRILPCPQTEWKRCLIDEKYWPYFQFINSDSFFQEPRFQTGRNHVDKAAITSVYLISEYQSCCAASWRKVPITLKMCSYVLSASRGLSTGWDQKPRIYLECNSFEEETSVCSSATSWKSNDTILVFWKSWGPLRCLNERVYGYVLKN